MKPIEILLVEDNPGDARLTREALAQSKIKNNLSYARDGEEAMAFLRRESGFSDAPTPAKKLMLLSETAVSEAFGSVPSVALPVTT